MDEFGNIEELRRVFSGEVDLSSENKKSALTADENEILKMAQKIRQNESENNVFRKQLDKYFSGAMPSHEVINVCSTPNLLKLFNSTAKKVVLNQKDLENAVAVSKSNNNHTEGHEIAKEEIYKLSEAIRNPIMVLKGNDRNKNSVVLITDLTNKNRENVFVPISLDRQNGKISNIATLYGKKNLSNYLSVHISDILAINTKKADMLADTEVQFFQSINDAVIRYDDSIAYTTQNVKNFDEKTKLIERRKNNMEYKNGLAKEEFLQYMYNKFPSAYENSHSKMLLENIVDYCTSNTFDTKNKLVPTLDILIPEVKREEIIRFVDKEFINTRDYNFEYQLLDRLRTDCNYFLNAGNGNTKYLWAGTVREQIDKMKELYQLLPLKPEWLDMSDIENYQKPMVIKEIKKIETTSLEDLKQLIKDLGWNIEDTKSMDNVPSWRLTNYLSSGKKVGFSFEHNNDVHCVLSKIFEQEDYNSIWNYNDLVSGYVKNSMELIEEGYQYGTPPTKTELTNDANVYYKMQDDLFEICHLFKKKMD